VGQPCVPLRSLTVQVDAESVVLGAVVIVAECVVVFTVVDLAVVLLNFEGLWVDGEAVVLWLRVAGVELLWLKAEVDEVLGL